MGLTIGNYIGIGKNSGKSLSQYWKNQIDTLLFFGQIKNISGGRLYNEMTGSSDYLTVGGSAGSWTFQCPNTAAYIAADTDYIWFKTDESQRTTTTAELIGYDLQRTPVKYNDTAPNAIVAIMILKAGETIVGTKRNYLFRDMWLPILWDNNLNAYGRIKSNRIGQQLWTPETVIPDIITDNNTLMFLDFMDSDHFTLVDTNKVAAWTDILDSGNSLVAPTEASRPTLEADGVLFDGINNYLNKSFTLNQPYIIYIVAKQITWTSGDVLIDGYSATAKISQTGSSPNIRFNNGFDNFDNTNLQLDTFGIIRLVVNGWSTKLYINNGTSPSGNGGTTNPGGLFLGSDRNGLNKSNIKVKGLIVRKISDTSGDQTIIREFLNTKYSI